MGLLVSGVKHRHVFINQSNAETILKTVLKLGALKLRAAAWHASCPGPSDTAGFLLWVSIRHVSHAARMELLQLGGMKSSTNI